MSASTQLSGIHPRSEQLIELTRSYDRGKTDRANVDKQLEQDILDLARLQKDSGFEIYSDGALYCQDQLRPIAESLTGVTTGTRYDRWFDTNTFYKKPTVAGKIRLGQFEPRRFIRSDLLPRGKEWKVTLIGPYTFSELSENLHYKRQSELISDVGNAEREIIDRLKTVGVSRFQISEPCLVYRPYRKKPFETAELDEALEALQRTIEGIRAHFTIQTYFGDSTRILPALLELPAGTIGVDLFETDYSQLKIETSKEIALGIVDCRESNVEDSKWIQETATRVSKHVSSGNITLVPNSDLKFVPRKVADAKVRALAEATKLLEDAQ